MNPGWIVLIVFCALLFIYALTIFILLPKKAYFSALFSGTYISTFKLIGLKLRKTNYQNIVEAYIVAKKSMIGLSIAQIESIAASGGNPLKVVNGVVSSRNAKLDFDIDFVKAIDISGRDVLQVIQECMNPKVIQIPLVTGVAQDNFEVSVKASLTLKVNIKNFLGGTTEDTVSARAVEAIVTKISNTAVAKSLTSRPELLDKAIFDAGVDTDSKYVLESADIVFIELGENKNALLEKQLIEKQNIIEKNKLEQRKILAAALEQEEKVKIQEAKRKIYEEEQEIPRALAQAVKDGKIKDIVDFYKLQNLQADTEMRRLMAKNYKNDKNED